MGVSSPDKPYSLDDQVGFILRKVMQRHLSLFAEEIPGLTNTQFAALAKLSELGPMSQNQLGRVTAMDAATIKGVVDRLARQELVSTAPDPQDRRRLVVSLTEDGACQYSSAVAAARTVTARTLEPLRPAERRRLIELLLRLT